MKKLQVSELRILEGSALLEMRTWKMTVTFKCGGLGNDLWGRKGYQSLSVWHNLKEVKHFFREVIRMCSILVNFTDSIMWNKNEIPAWQIFTQQSINICTVYSISGIIPGSGSTSDKKTLSSLTMWTFWCSKKKTKSTLLLC